jgi:hypothetical protein
MRIVTLRGGERPSSGGGIVSDTGGESARDLKTVFDPFF